MNCPAARNCRKGQMCRLHDSRSPCHLSGNALMKPGWTIHFSSFSSACLRSKDIPCCTHHEVLLPQLRTVALSTCHLGHYPLPQGQPRIYRNPYPRHSHDLMSYMKTNNHASSLEPLHPRFAAAIGRSFSGLDSVALLLRESCAIAFICAGLSSGSCQNRWFCQSQIRPQLRGAISGGMRPISYTLLDTRNSAECLWGRRNMCLRLRLSCQCKDPTATADFHFGCLGTHKVPSSRPETMWPSFHLSMTV
jgi:hypothetical protein